MTTPTPDEICERLRQYRYTLPDGFYSDKDYGCNEDDPRSLIMAILDSGPQGEKVMQELTACGYSIVKTEDADEAAGLIQQQLTTIERLSAALERIESYKWPEFVGEYTETFFGEATGEEYKLKHPITKETSLRALNNVKAIARAVLESIRK